MSPALLICCSEEQGEEQTAPTRIELAPPGATKAESWWLIRRTDVFVFDSRSGELLDSYQQSFLHRDLGITVWSGTGSRRAVVIANLELPEDIATEIATYDDLQKIYTSLTKDDPQYPVMCGEASYMAGRDKVCQVSVTPVLCKLDISLRCVFGKRGEARELENVQVFLTGLSGRASVSPGPVEPSPSEILCYPDQSEKDLRQMTYPRMIYQYIGTLSNYNLEGPSAIKYTTLYCYPNPTTADTASIGAPVTTLVIEGSYDGQSIRRTLPLEDLRRNTRYEINITVK